MSPGGTYRFVYDELERTTRTGGLDSAQIERLATKFCVRSGDTYQITKAAYRPTGVALGCPLPDPSVASRLERAARRVEAFIRGTCPSSDRWFAHVPSSSYHVTIVNRGHFDTSAVVDLDVAARNRLASRLRGFGRVALDVEGLVLTRHGRLLAKGFPQGDRITALRQQILALAPELAENLPQAAHIKLGHVLVPLDVERTHEFFAEIRALDADVSASLVFHELFTPVGRIALDS